MPNTIQLREEAHKNYLMRRLRQLRHDERAIQHAIDAGEAAPNELDVAMHLKWAQRGAHALYMECRSFGWTDEAMDVLRDTKGEA